MKQEKNIQDSPIRSGLWTLCLIFAAIFAVPIAGGMGAVSRFRKRKRST